MKKQPINNANRQAYGRLCEEHQMPLFLSYWWLEGVEAGKDWDVILVRDAEQDGRVIAALPYEVDKRLWLKYVRQPEMTPYSGPWVDPEYLKDPAQVARIAEEIAAQLKALRLRSYRQYFPIDSPMPEALCRLSGFKSIMRRTYVLSTKEGAEACYQGFSRNKRKKMDQIREKYKVVDVDPEEFYLFHRDTNAQKRMSINYSREMLLVIWEKALQHGAARLVGIRDEEDQLLAASLLVWDHTTLYQLVNTFDHDYPDNGARELLTYETISQAARLGLDVDFVHHRDYLKHYGAKKCNYYSVHRGTMPLVFLQRIMTWWEHL